MLDLQFRMFILDFCCSLSLAYVVIDKEAVAATWIVSALTRPIYIWKTPKVPLVNTAIKVQLLKELLHIDVGVLFDKRLQAHRVHEDFVKRQCFHD